MMTLRIGSAVLACITVLLVSPPSAAGDYDHLSCFTMLDRSRVKATVDLVALTPELSRAGCRIVRPRLFCAPVDKDVTESNIPLLPVSGEPQLSSKVCYKLRCPPPHMEPPVQNVTDQFGHHSLRGLRPRFLCGPIGAPSNCTPQPDVCQGGSNNMEPCPNGLADCPDAGPGTTCRKEVPCNGLDENCNGNSDDRPDTDRDGSAVCDDCDDGDPERFPGNIPEKCDGLDNDCDGIVPEDELDRDADNQWACEGDCDPNDPSVYLGATETCGASQCTVTVDTCVRDETLDAWVRQPCVSIAPPRTCEGGTNRGEPCAVVSDCPDDSAGTECAAALDLCDGLDNDCDTDVDEDVMPPTFTCGIGACAAETDHCIDGVPQPCQARAPSEELCDTDVDENCNGLVDEPGCICPTGSADCDFLQWPAENRCEVDTTTDPNHCGRCRHMCDGSEACREGQCVPS